MANYQLQILKTHIYGLIRKRKKPESKNKEYLLEKININF